MRLHKFRTISLFSFALMLWPPPSSSTAAQTHPTGKPNVLFIAVDDLRPELGCYGSRTVLSPNIDRLAQQGLVFTRAYCQQAVCNPSRASLLTGLRPDSIRVWDLETHFRKQRPNIVTLPQHFKNHGYQTVGLGKIFHDTLPDPTSWSRPEPENPVSYHYLSPETRARQWNRAANAGRLGRSQSWIYAFLRGPATECMKAEDNQYRDGSMTDAALKIMHELKDQGPFFLAVGFYKPHLPFVAPKKYWDLYEREKLPLAANNFLPQDAPLFAINSLQELMCYEDFVSSPRPTEGPLSEQQARLLKHGYYACVSYIDAQIGRLLDAVEEWDLRDNTIIVLWGDHGWKLGEHNSWGKRTNYEVDTLSPLIISTPGARGNGRTTSSLVEFVDIYPTLCELADLPLPKGLEGFSLVPLLNDPDRYWKHAVFSQFQRGFTGRYMGRSVRTPRYRYVEWRDWIDRRLIAVELYDHDTDPQENINIAHRPANEELTKTLTWQLRRGWWNARPEIKRK